MKKIFTLENLHLLLGAHIVLWLNAACYGLINDIIPSVVKLGLVGLWFLICFVRHSKFFSTYIAAGLLLAMFVFLSYITQSSFDVGYYSQYGMNYVYILILIAVFGYYFYYGTKNEIKVLLSIFLLDVAIVTVRTSIKLQTMPELARIISTSSEAKLDMLGSGAPKAVGGYGLCYELVFLQPMLSYILNKRKVKAIIKIAIYAFIMFFLFQAQITLAFLMYPIMILLSLTYGNENKDIALVLRLLTVSLGVVLIAVLPTILSAIIESADSHLAERLNEVLGFLVEGSMGGDDMQTRMDLYKISLKSFSNSPLWGAFGQKVYGSHSTLLDILAAYGLVGLTGYFGLFRPLQLTQRYLRQKKQSLQVIRTVGMSAVVVSVLNVLVGIELMSALIIFVPLASKYFADEEEANNSEIVSNQCNA